MKVGSRLRSYRLSGSLAVITFNMHPKKLTNLLVIVHHLKPQLITMPEVSRINQHNLAEQYFTPLQTLDSLARNSTPLLIKLKRNIIT
jgi:hypothetical protein